MKSLASLDQPLLAVSEPDDVLPAFGSRAIGNVTNDGFRNRFPNCRVLCVDEETAASYAAFRSELKAGTPIPSNDIGIAALSRHYGLAILSKDRLFDHVPGLLRVDWGSSGLAADFQRICQVSHASPLKPFPSAIESSHTLSPTGNSRCATAATKSSRKVLRSSPRAHYILQARTHG